MAMTTLVLGFPTNSRSTDRLVKTSTWPASIRTFTSVSMRRRSRSTSRDLSLPRDLGKYRLSTARSLSPRRSSRYSDVAIIFNERPPSSWIFDLLQIVKICNHRRRLNEDEAGEDLVAALGSASPEMAMTMLVLGFLTNSRSRDRLVRTSTWPASIPTLTRYP
ncbi:hypothetical protein L484_020425 [Morus notabilis]|uniref:Uncharacterized protein n=1 Tax=Morus notabilis TaxID=981085 RepID=W9SBL6_9ROSA|nr:hypothetical protein L484_020425 [Morus notabilis]